MQDQLEKSFVAPEVTHSIVNAVAKDEGVRDNEEMSTNSSAMPAFTVRKFLARPGGRRMDEAFGRFTESKSEMDETTARKYKSKLAQGASTAQALAYAGSPEDLPHATGRSPVRFSYPGSRETVQAERVSTRPVGEGLVRGYAVSENNPLDRARKSFRIAKHASISATGKAIERHERGQSTSRDKT